VSDVRPSLALPDLPRLVSALQVRRLGTPACLFLELLKPWRFVASQMLIMSEPLCGAHGRETMQRYAAWLDAPGGIEALQEALELPPAGRERRS
jgi:hypothetical protein